MQKFIFILTIFALTLNLNSSPVMKMVKELVDKNSFRQHRSLINKIFENEKKFIKHGKVNIISVLKKLKTNGILKLFLNKPRSIQISFSGKDNPIFFMKIISDSLQDLGYFKYRVLKATKNKRGFVWTIEFISDYILDPTLLYASLVKKGCKIVKINRNALLQWSYSIDTTNAFLNVTDIKVNKKIRLKTPVFDFWLKINGGKTIDFRTISNNRWHPYIAFYNRKLILIKVFKDDRRRKNLKLKIPKNTKYIKVTDIYLLNNLKNGLRVELK